MASDEDVNIQWHPLSFIENDSDEIALIVLNTPLQPIKKLLNILWNKAVFKACVDGGLNELYSCMPHGPRYLPDLISGDFDSARPDVLHFYRDQGCDICNTPDQDSTDFTKCLEILCNQIEKKHLKVNSIVVLWSNDGRRFDHMMANINTLYLAKQWTKLPIYLVSDGCVTTLLSAGRHTIHVHTGYEGRYCGLLPIGSPCHHVTTTGLEWNLCNSSLQFGELVSSSNSYSKSCPGIVTIETDQPLTWTMDFELKLNGRDYDCKCSL